MNTQRLPNEILLQIFELALSEAVYQRIFACKAWSFAAIQAYYKDPSLNGTMITLLLCAMDTLVKKRKPHMTIGQENTNQIDARY
jgi:hypothetical protein